MASCSLGATSIKLSKLDFCVAGVGTQQRANGARQLKVRRQFQYVGLALSNKPKKAFAICCDPSLEAEATANRVEEFKETKSSGLTSQLIPNSSEIESLVSEICNTASIVEFELKLNGFRLYVTRNITEKSEPPPQPASAHAPPPALVGANAAAGASDLSGSVSTTALVVSKPVPSSEGIQSFLNRASDEGLMILQSPRVGFFRRSRTIKGKRAPPSCKEKQIVKEGQVLCYIEQLGGELPIESDVSGEVIKILRDDGEPVGYGDALIAILPSFPGIKKLQ